MRTYGNFKTIENHYYLPIYIYSKYFKSKYLNSKYLKGGIGELRAEN